MSYESTIEPPRGLFAALRQALFGLPKKPADYAHPWTAYGPANFQVRRTASPTSAANGQAGGPRTTCLVKQEPPVATDLVAQPVPAEVIELVEVSPPPTRRDRRPANGLPAPVSLKLIESHTIPAPAIVLPAPIAATGQDFQLAARLHSVSLLNRALAPTAVKKATKPSGRNRPVAPVSGTKQRRRRIEPPATRRKIRVSAEIIELKLALARAGGKQVRVKKVA